MNKEVKHESLASALAAFQAELPSVVKGSVNPHFKSKFADLTELSKIVLPALAVQGLAWSVVPRIEGGAFMLTGILLHESGEKLEGQYPMTIGKPQDIGSGMTYGRRYLLGAMTGVSADDDDDGNAAQGAKPAPKLGPLPSEWRKRISEAEDVEKLTNLHGQAVADGWATTEVMKALTARKKVLTDGPDSGTDS